MKKFIISICALLVIVGIISLCGCSNDLEKEYEFVIGAQQKTTRAEYSTAAPKNNVKPYDKLISKEVDIHYFAENYELNGVDLYNLEIKDIASDLGIECLRETDGGALYSVHKVKQGGLLYIFYTNWIYPRGEDYPGEIIEDVGRGLHWYYVKEKLSQKDFSSIKEGDEIDDVIKIDPVTQIYKNLNSAKQKKGSEWHFSAHYLEDGIVDIKYIYKDGKYIVDDIYFDDFIMDDGRSGRIKNRYDGKILPMDWVE